MLEVEVAAVSLPVLEVLLEALLATTGEELGELSSSATATDAVELEAVEAAELGTMELGGTAPGGA